MSYVRCSHCAARRTLPKALKKYVRPPACRVCGKRKYRVDKWRAKNERAPHVKPCKCHLRPINNGGYWFLHRKGSKHCAENPKLTTKMLEDFVSDRRLTKPA